MPFKLRDLSGQVFGRLRVVEFSHFSEKQHHAYWKCVCSCGVEKTIRGSHLTGGTTVSCTCLNRELASKLNTSHGHGYESPTYRSWHSMMSRCNNPNSKNYKYWGGRGIKVCERWFKFENFLSDMGLRPPGTTLDRKKADEHYEPDNCRWAGPVTQVRNRRFEIVNFNSNLIGLLSFGC